MIGMHNPVTVVDGHVDNRGYALCQGVGETAREVVGLLDPVAHGAERLGQLHEVGVAELDPERLAELLDLLPPDQTVAFVTEHEGHERPARPPPAPPGPGTSHKPPPPPHPPPPGRAGSAGWARRARGSAIPIAAKPLEIRT